MSNCHDHNGGNPKPANIHETLDRLTEKTNYFVIQNNGQRIFCPKPSSGFRTPARGSEIFVGNLPSNFYEDELIPLFSKIGALYNVRVMLDFSGKSRGYAFLSYFVPEHAHLAVKCFNGYGIRENKTKISVSLSVDNRRLFVGNVPRNRTAKDLQEALLLYVGGIVTVILYPEPQNPRLNRGFAFVEFETHRLAAIARRQLAPGNLTMWGQALFVDWAEPLPLINPEVLRQVTILYLSNVPVHLTSDELDKIICDFLNMTHNITKIHKANHWAFVHFSDRQTAEAAMVRLAGLIIYGQQISVEWARPIEFSKKNRLNFLSDNFCRSVPPLMRKEVQHRLEMRQLGKKSLSTDSRSTSYSLSTSPRSYSE